MTLRDATEGTFAGAAGHRIYWRSWPVIDPRAVVLLAHGFGEHSGRYEPIAEHLSSEGYEVYALDHHGHGRSTGARGQISLQDAVDDLDQLVLLAESRHPDSKAFLLGHSMGGAISIRYAIDHGHRLAGLILSAPLAQVDGRTAAKAAGRILGRFLPGLPLARIDPKLVSRNPSVVAALEFDPLFFRAVPAGAARQFLDHGGTLPDDVRRVTLPTLLMWGSADQICAPAGSEMIAARIGSGDLTTRVYDGLYHDILNEPERDQVVAEIDAWLAARVYADAAR